ncbi:hypothetical protein HIM_01682 [Hirsutella minnesotensis 3608]|nr:hypothetical protein HIM_01682 [Hirsutella minnesotensis 3608]
MVVQTRKRKAAQEQAAREAASAEGSPKRQKLPVRSKDDEKAEAETAAKGTLITFGDDDEVKNETTAPAPSSAKAGPSVEEVQGEESDDDAAPEAVSTAQVASDMKKSAQAAQKAAREQAAAEKRRRQERDALLKKQAEERKEAERAAAAAESLSAPDGDDKDGASLDRVPGRRQGRRAAAAQGQEVRQELQGGAAAEGPDGGQVAARLLYEIEVNERGGPPTPHRARIFFCPLSRTQVFNPRLEAHAA